VVSSTLGPGTGINFSGASSLQTGSSAPGYADNRPNPPTGNGFWYLVEARNFCGIGGYRRVSR